MSDAGRTLLGRHQPTNFYKVSDIQFVTPTHDSNGNGTNGTAIYYGPLSVPAGQHKYFRAIGYKAGMVDAAPSDWEVDNTTGGNGPQPAGTGENGQPGYDANGNLTSYKDWTYTYDAQNRLTSASNGTTSAEFYYDGKNRQIARNVGGVVRFSVWNNWELLEESAGGTQWTTSYLQGATGVIKSWGGNGTFYYYQDKLGSTTHIANASGGLVESYHYDLYGTPAETSTHGIVDLYAGERWIPELSLYDLRNRFMSPELGRFLQADPIGFKGDASNLYRYCGNDPVDRSDPTGLASSPDDIVKPNLTMFGQGDWMRLGSPFTNGDLLSKVQNYLGELKSSVDREVNKANAESRDVKWSADYSNWLKSKENFKDGQIATTDLSTKSEAVMNANGTVARFNVNLHIDINWNEGQSRYFGRALRTDTFGLGKTGEIEHARDALKALTSSYGGSRPARAIANEQAATMVGQSISQQEASSRMDAALVDWRIKTTNQSREDRDASWQHRY